MLFQKALISSKNKVVPSGSLWAWGHGYYGQLGDLTTTDKSSPVLVSGPTGSSWISIKSSISDSTNQDNIHILALKSDKTLWVWGTNLYGQLGLGYSDGSYSSPVITNASTSWTKIASGSIHGLGIKSNGTLWSWGDSVYGQLGNNQTDTRYSPVLVSGPASTSWSQIAAGEYHSLAITTAGRLYAWGVNDTGQLGDLTTTNKSSPVLVSGPASTSWSQIAAGTNHSLAITTTGQLYAWGYNNAGQLGDSTITDKSSPVLVSGPASTSWSFASTGLRHSAAITTTGQLYAWGQGTFGSLGNLATANRSSPVVVSGPAATSWTSVSSNLYANIGIVA